MLRLFLLGGEIDNEVKCFFGIVLKTQLKAFSRISFSQWECHCLCGFLVLLNQFLQIVPW